MGPSPSKSSPPSDCPAPSNLSIDEQIANLEKKINDQDNPQKQQADNILTSDSNEAQRLRNIRDAPLAQARQAADIEDLRRQLDTSNSQRQQYLNQYTNASNELINKNAEITRLNALIATISADNTAYKQKIKELTSEILQLTTEIEKLITTINGLNDTIIIYSNKLKLYDLQIKDLNTNIVTLTQDNWSDEVYNNLNLLDLASNLDVSLNSLFYYLKQKNINPDVMYEKINYRSIEHQKLYNINKVLDILFYCFYFSFILIIIFTRNTKTENFLIYLFVALIPFIYPFIFKFVSYIVNYLSTHTNGPKNAFVDINSTIYAYNI
jgi:chromosome segregation ATPase